MFDDRSGGSRTDQRRGALDSGLVAALLTLLLYGGLYVLSVESTWVVAVSPTSSSGLMSRFEPVARYNSFGVLPDPLLNVVFGPAHAVDRRLFANRWESVSLPVPVTTRRRVSQAPVHVLPEDNALRR